LLIYWHYIFSENYIFVPDNPPKLHFAVEDGFDVADTGCNQSSNYRVTGYTFEYDLKQAQYTHRIDLSAP